MSDKKIFYLVVVLSMLAACTPPVESLTGSDVWRDNAGRPFESLRHD